MVRPTDNDVVVLRTVNCSMREKADSDSLVRCFDDDELLRRWRWHLAVLFTEVGGVALDRFLADHAIAPRAALATYRRVRDLTGDEKPDVEARLGEMASASR